MNLIIAIIITAIIIGHSGMGWSRSRTLVQFVHWAERICLIVLLLWIFVIDWPIEFFGSPVIGEDLFGITSLILLLEGFFNFKKYTVVH